MVLYGSSAFHEHMTVPPSFLGLQLCIFLLCSFIMSHFMHRMKSVLQLVYTQCHSSAAGEPAHTSGACSGRFHTPVGLKMTHPVFLPVSPSFLISSLGALAKENNENCYKDSKVFTQFNRKENQI